jgi:hypothetical protein
MINPEYFVKAKQHLTAATKTGITIAKYGATFTGGVLVGTICGVVLFFKIGNDPI